MQERIKKIILNEGLSVRKFESLIGVSEGVISKALRNSTDISAKVLISIKEKFPQYSSEWLLTGEGPMYKSEVRQPEQENTEPMTMEERKLSLMESMAQDMKEIKINLYRLRVEQEKREEASNPKSNCG